MLGGSNWKLTHLEWKSSPPRTFLRNLPKFFRTIFRQIMHDYYFLSLRKTILHYQFNFSNELLNDLSLLDVKVFYCKRQYSVINFEYLSPFIFSKELKPLPRIFKAMAYNFFDPFVPAICIATLICHFEWLNEKKNLLCN